jgi:phosphate:Na+ symporter
LATTISIFGGVGLFLLGMGVMTEGLKALAGSALRGVLSKAAATPLLGTFWGAIITLLVQSSSATTMTTIGLVSAGLLTFPQGLSLVFGANIGTTGTGWLVALLGVRISLTTAALPIIFVGALLKLLGRGRLAGCGSAVAGFALILVGLTTLQQGMSGLAEQLNPADLPSVIGETGVKLWSGIGGVLVLVLAGIVMTTVMQSSTAAIAVTLSALYAGAVGLDQTVALVTGQNIGTATSSTMAAIGASSTAKRLAVAYIAFKLVAAVVALLLFSPIVRLMIRAAHSIDAVTLVAVYHTGYNVVGVAILLPLIAPFTRMIERIVPERRSALTTFLDPASLMSPVVAIEASRRTVARILGLLCSSSADRLEHASRGGAANSLVDSATLDQTSDALQATREFLSHLTDPLPSEEEQQWFISLLHALDHTIRMVDVTKENVNLRLGTGGADEQRALQLCLKAMRRASSVGVGLVHASVPKREEHPGHVNADALPVASLSAAVQCLKSYSIELTDVIGTHRRATLESVVAGALTTDDAIDQVDAVRFLGRLAHHAWRAATHLAGAVVQY